MDDEYICVMVMGDQTEVHFLNGLFQSRGIESYINRENIRGIDTIDGKKFPIFIQKKDVENVRQILEERRNFVIPNAEWKRETQKERDEFDYYRRMVWFITAFAFYIMAASTPSYAARDVFLKLLFFGGGILSMGFVLFSKDERRSVRR